jgi:hypothetical protein
MPAEAIQVSKIAAIPSSLRPREKAALWTSPRFRASSLVPRRSKQLTRSVNVQACRVPAAALKRRGMTRSRVAGVSEVTAPARRRAARSPIGAVLPARGRRSRRSREAPNDQRDRPNGRTIGVRSARTINGSAPNDQRDRRASERSASIPPERSAKFDSMDFRDWAEASINFHRLCAAGACGGRRCEY